jgi:DNA/RNA-binding domain of Phe-tRNA-synthetase-like protein
MATRSNPRKQRRGKRPLRQSEPISDAEREDLALAEELLRVSRGEEADFIAGWKKFMKQLGIKSKPIGAKKLRERLLKKGFNPESNEFSQGIIAMREE